MLSSSGVASGTSGAVYLLVVWTEMLFPEYREAFSFLGPLTSLNRALSDEDEVVVFHGKSQLYLLTRTISLWQVSKTVACSPTGHGY